MHGWPFFVFHGSQGPHGFQLTADQAWLESGDGDRHKDVGPAMTADSDARMTNRRDLVGWRCEGTWKRTRPSAVVVCVFFVWEVEVYVYYTEVWSDGVVVVVVSGLGNWNRG